MFRIANQRSGNASGAAKKLLQQQQQRLQALQKRWVSYNGEELFDKVLIANRGEIACRVMRTCQKLGIKTVSIFSDADRYSMHTLMADEAHYVGPPPSAESYLNIDRIMEIIKETGAQAVHPGYGFLSENHLFAEALEANNVSFIGPGSFAITSMGDKIQSKKLAADAGVSTVPGSLAVVHTDEQIKEIANDIGYPVMIKASAGGGGKGMRIAYNDEEALEGFRLSTEEARASFGDDRIFIEKFVEEPRHIEIQVIADKHGNVAALPERECSIQRRNQKVLEEAPSSFIDPETRKKMQAEAIQLAKAVDYCSAGTVEMLVDKHKNFYFLEMNTRLQVEHPVTELVAGVDLVEQMIRVAAGHKLPDDIMDPNRPILGWAHEARVYAEDPFRGFLPSIGRLNEYKEPANTGSKEVRIDTGISQGDEISMYYDPMICKLITHGEDRAQALGYLEDAIDNYVIKGLGHNLNFLRDCTRHPKFRSGDITTKFIEEEYPDGFKGVQLNDEETLYLAWVSGVLNSFQQETVEDIEGKLRDVPDQDEYYTTIDGKTFLWQFIPSEEDEKEGTVFIKDVESGKELLSKTLSWIEWSPGQTLAKCFLDEGDGTTSEHVLQVLEETPLGFKIQYLGAIKDVILQSPKEYKYSKHMIEKPELDFSKWLRSPMPGTLVSVAVQPGDKVFAGQELAVVEAMKMQNVLRAEKSGVVKKVYCDAGHTLAVDEEIIEFE